MGRRKHRKSDKREEVETPPSPDKKYLPLLVPILVFFFAFMPRLYFMSAGLFYTDTVICAEAVEETFRTGELHYMHGAGYPGQVILVLVVYVIHHLLTGVASAEFAVLFSGVLFGSLAVMMVYLVARELTDSVLAGILSAVIFSLLPVYISVTTFGMSHGASEFFLLLSAYLAIKAGKLDSNKLKIAAAAALGYSSAIRITNLPFTAVLFLLYWRSKPPLSLSMDEGLIRLKLNESKSALLKDVFLLIFPVLIVFILPYIPMLRSSGIAPITSASGENRFLGFFSPVFPVFFEWINASVTSFGWPLILIGFAVLLKEDKYLALVMLLWGGVFFMYFGNTITTEDRHVITALIAFSMLMSVALNWFYDRLGWIIVALILLALLYPMVSRIYPILEYRSHFCGGKDFALNVKNLVGENSMIIAMDETPHLFYYAGLRTMGHSASGNSDEIRGDMERIRGLLDNGTGVYIITSGFGYDAGSRFQNALISEFKVYPVASFQNEDWHKKNVFSGLWNETVFRIERR